MTPTPFWLGILLVVAAVILQTGIAPVPIVLGLSLALAVRNRLLMTLGWAAGGAVLLEVMSIAPIGAVALPVVVAAGATQAVGSRWLVATGPWRTSAILIGGSVLAAGIDALLQGWNVREALPVGVSAFAFAAAWSIVLKLLTRTP